MNNAMNFKFAANVPAIYATEPADNVSKKYTFIPTTKIMEDMVDLGYEAVAASRKLRGDKYYGWHTVTFKDEVKRSIDFSILMENSHNAKHSFSFSTSFYVNGQYFYTDCNHVRIRHMGYDFSTLQEGINELVMNIPDQISLIEKMQNTSISSEALVAFATDVLKVRFNREDLTSDDAELLLKEIGTITNFWSAFERIYWTIMRGGFQRRSKNGRIRKTTCIKSMQRTIKLSQQMFNLAIKRFN